MADQPVIIIRKKKKGGHPAHHGGAWKVAYADFVTAMMSFFLLLWLLNVTTSEQRKGLADYFAPAGISASQSGAGSVFSGRSISSTEGAEISDRSPPSTQESTVPTVGQGEEGEEDVAGTGNAKKGNAKPVEKAETPSGASKEALSIGEAIKNEEDGFKAAEQTLKQAILESPALQPFYNQIIVDRTPEGLRIQIIDREKLSMFPSASAIPYERARDLLLMVGKVISQLPNRISIAGHTDSLPFVMGSGRDNWSLSTERANTCREYIVKAGVDEKKIARVSGLADREPYVDDPKDPRNRRIGIVLLRQGIEVPSVAINPTPVATSESP